MFFEYFDASWKADWLELGELRWVIPIIVLDLGNKTNSNL